jgi:DNA-binding transcriptional MerR regulator
VAAMNDTNDYTVGAVAELTGVSVRTLHHYDEIGLLEPGRRNTAGYRLYAPEELRRLQRILFYRELGFGLDAIAVILADPGSTDGDHLEHQRELLTDRIARLTAMLTAVDRELAARAAGVSLTPQERLEVFGTTRLEERAEQVERRWGGTAEWWPPACRGTSTTRSSPTQSAPGEAGTRPETGPISRPDQQARSAGPISRPGQRAADSRWRAR